MNTKTSSIIAVCCAVLLVPVAFAISTEVERKQTEQAIFEAKQKTWETQSSVFDIETARAQQLEELGDVESIIEEIMNEKQQVRQQLVEKRQLARVFSEQFGIDATDEEQVTAFYLEQNQEAREFLQAYARRVVRVDSEQTLGSIFRRSLFGVGLGERVQEDLAYRVMRDVRSDLLSRLAILRDLPRTVALLTNSHANLLSSLHAAQGDYREVKQQVQLSDEQLDEIARIEAEVGKQIQDMQGQLKSYDEQIQLRLEKQLVALGLAKPRPGGYKKPTFIWPVIGRITARFDDAGYIRYFGVPHNALDIAQPQGSPVLSAADGIVHHIQHGGLYGYSYILIAHQGGYTTLYGHMYDIHVQVGDNVSQGDVIGLSGGMPGTRGAGPMTTGPHLHFMVTKDGIYIDPETILP